MAPEIILEEPYGPCVDFWALGVLAYELILGGSPFQGDDLLATCTSVLGKDLGFPAHVTPELQALISGFLERDPGQRLGHEGQGVDPRNGLRQIKDHPFFAGVDWDMALVKGVDPKLKPRVPEVAAGVAARRSPNVVIDTAEDMFKRFDPFVAVPSPDDGKAERHHGRSSSVAVIGSPPLHSSVLATGRSPPPSLRNTASISQRKSLFICDDAQMLDLEGYVASLSVEDRAVFEHSTTPTSLASGGGARRMILDAICGIVDTINDVNDPPTTTVDKSKNSVQQWFTEVRMWECIHAIDWWTIRTSYTYVHLTHTYILHIRTSYTYVHLTHTYIVTYYIPPSASRTGRSDPGRQPKHCLVCPNVHRT
jgi:serine/threonine protein kinase